jgi:hypothetical protein
MPGVTDEFPETLELGYSRTVDRSVVHKSAVSEVFVTDIRPVADYRVSTAVQLPPAHAYYGDHTQSPAVHDALLLLECGRQAAIAGTHTHVGFSHDVMMIVDTFTFRLDDLKALVIGPEPGELRIDTRYIGSPGRSGRFRRGRVEQRFVVRGRPVGEHAMNVLFLTKRENDALRKTQRGTPAPLTSDYTDTPVPPGMAEPWRVGRAHPANVVLSDVRAEDGAARAAFTPNYRNRSLFDHTYDHLPAMTLVEAARQLATVAMGRPESTYTVAVNARFGRFAELDAPVTASTPLPGPADETGRVVLPVAFHQSGADIASVEIAMGSLL